MENDVRLPVVNPMIVFREESDGWAILFDPDANTTFALDPVSVFIWKRLDGNTSRKDILLELDRECEDGIPDDATQDLDAFLDELEQQGLIGFEI